MPGKFNLSETETEVMEMIWARDCTLSFKEIMDYFNNEGGKCWKKQTIRTYLTRLIDKGALKAEKAGNKCNYYPSMSKVEYAQKWTKGLLDTAFGGSVKNFISAFTGGKKLNAEDAEELREFLNEDI